ncbi:Uncharacterised protein [Bordetella pertussis]|nr:Uncharacterised protein [Bordetella pertussis]
MASSVSDGSRSPGAYAALLIASRMALRILR